jgi:rhamnulokinase
MLRVEDDRWDPEILGMLNLDEDKLGRVVPPGTRLGPVRLREFQQYQMENVAVCGHDTACVVAALPVENPDFAFISAGTWCIVGLESEKPLISEEARRLGITNERAYGNRYRPLKNIVGLWLLQGLRKELRTGISYEQMEEMIREEAAIPQVIDPDAPLFYNPGNMKEAFKAYFEKTGQTVPTRFSDYIRCAYDSLCFSFRFHTEELEKLSGKPIGVLHMVGGGSQSDYLCQRVATVCRREVVAGPVEGASMGNILIQALAMGRIGSLKEGRELVKRSCRVRNYRPAAASPDLEERYKKYLILKHHKP